jgi:hypothetical protein
MCPTSRWRFAVGCASSILHLTHLADVRAFNGGNRGLPGALEEWSRNQVPILLAQRRHNLGIALEVLGESGTTDLEETVAARRVARLETTNEKQQKAPRYQ